MSPRSQTPWPPGDDLAVCEMKGLALDFEPQTLSSFYLGVVLVPWSPRCFSGTWEGGKMRFRAAFPGTRKALSGQ